MLENRLKLGLWQLFKINEQIWNNDCEFKTNTLIHLHVTKNIIIIMIMITTTTIIIMIITLTSIICISIRITNVIYVLTIPLISGEKPHKCHICGRCFPHSSTLVNHIRGHTGEKCYKCQWCGRPFTCRNYLRTHIRVHTGICIALITLSWPSQVQQQHCSCWCDMLGSNHDTKFKTYWQIIDMQC